MVLRRHGRHRQHEIRQVHPLAVADLARDLDLGVDCVVGVGNDPEPHLAIVDQQQPARLGGREDLGMQQRHALGRGGLRIHVEAQLLAFLEIHRLLADHPQAQLGALQVHQDGHGMIVFLLHRTDLADTLPVILRCAMAEVEPEDVGSSLEECTQALGRRAGGSQRGDDLGETLTTHRVQPTSWVTTL